MPLIKTPSQRRDAGFAMVALLVGMAVAAVWMTAALPAWRQQVQRQKEDDLIFRGEQYARAIVLFQQKNRGANPPSVDVLVSGHYLRKKWKDPITGKDFFLIGNGVSQPVGSSQQQQSGRAGQPGGQQNQQTQQGQQPGITGVRSESTATSIKIYQNQQQYNLWQFDGRLMEQRMLRQQQQNGGQPGRQGGDRGGPQQPGRGGQQQAPGRGGQQMGAPGRDGSFQPVGGRQGSAPPPSGRAGGS